VLPTSTNFTLAYPVSHGLRRNFTLQPWVDFTDLAEFFTQLYKDANASFTPEVIDGLVANYTGDFKGFQTYMEGFEGPHSAVHESLGGYITFLTKTWWSSDFNRPIVI
jgi:tyrosinase